MRNYTTTFGDLLFIVSYSALSLIILALVLFLWKVNSKKPDKN
ncbi:hypothetical protein [Bacillus marinisedimentorum]|nr:hypothetical protein [Bacillus marinisedimentorum]